MKKYLTVSLITLIVILGGYLLLTKTKIGEEKIIEVEKGNLPPLGNPAAPITIIEFGDYLCPFCGKAVVELYPQLEGLINQGKIVLYYRDFIVHPPALEIANAARCAQEQEKFWEYKKELYRKFMNNEETKTKESWMKLAQDLGLDLEKFEKCVDEKRYVQDVQNDTNYAFQIGVNGTPTFFINGRKIIGINIPQIWSVLNQLQIQK